jgi:hypothetical protein
MSSTRVSRDEVFAALKELWQPYAQRANVTRDDPTSYILEGEFSDRWKRSMFLGGVRLGRAYISYYLMPIYTHPDLLENVSAELRKRLDGKSCFNFKRVEPELFEQLAELTRSCMDVYQKEGYAR